MPYSSHGTTTDAAHQRLTASQSSICVFLLSLSHVGHHIPIACWASYSYFRLFCFVYLHSFSVHSLRLSGTSSSSCPKTVTIGSSAGSDHKFSFQLFSQNQMFALVNCINFDWTQSICWDLILDHRCNARSLSFISNKGPEWIGASSSSAWCGMYGTDEMEG